MRSEPLNAGVRFTVENPYPDDSTLAFRRLAKDKLAEVQALFDLLSGGATIYGDTTVLDETPLKPVADYVITFTGNVSFSDGSSGNFNVTRALRISADLKPNDEGDVAFGILLENAIFQAAMEEALNQIT